MKKEYIALYKKLLFNLPQTTPALKTYAIVDSIRDERIKEKILFSNLNHTDLWHEELFENEQEVPLYLIELEKENELLDHLLTQHKESIATYFISPYDIETLKCYYSVFTHVNIEVEADNFQKAIFGFYDPNILPNYIQTLYNQEKIDEFFAGVAIWLSPSIEKEGELYLAFRSKAGHIDDVSLQLEPLLEEEHPMLNFEDVSLPTLANLKEYAHEIYIDQKQLAVFEEMEKRRFCYQILGMLDKKNKLYASKEELMPKACQGFDKAIELGLKTESTQGRFIWLWLYIKENYLDRYENVFTQIKHSRSEYEKEEIIEMILTKMQLLEEENNEV